MPVDFGAALCYKRLECDETPGFVPSGTGPGALSGGLALEILLVMCAGVLVGAKLFPRKYARINERLQTVTTVLLIFSMGVTLGRRENFLRELGEVGWRSLVLCLLPVIGSVICVYFLTRSMAREKRRQQEEKKAETPGEEAAS